MKNTSKPSNKLILHRYHARDAAVVLASFYKAKVLLGSATPSIETYFNGKSGKYGLVEIKERYGNVMMPDIKLVDLKDKYFRKKNERPF
jgi:primosomal protein N' (replication factor Y)